MRKYTKYDFCKRLKDCIFDHGYSLPEFADKYNYSRTTVYAWTRGDRVPTLYCLSRLCKQLNVTADYLMFGKEGG